MVLKRNLVRLALLVLLLAIGWGVSVFKGANRYSVAPHTLAKARLMRVESPARVLLTLEDPREKKVVPAKMLAVADSSLDPSLRRQCEESLAKRLEGETVWIKSAYLGRSSETVGKLLMTRTSGGPEDVAVAQLEAGCVFYCPTDERYLSSADRETYVAAEKHAKESRLGVWERSQEKLSADCAR